jgi:hypothetical protein
MLDKTIIASMINTLSAGYVEVVFQLFYGCRLYLQAMTPQDENT